MSNSKLNIFGIEAMNCEERTLSALEKKPKIKFNKEVKGKPSASLIEMELRWIEAEKNVIKAAKNLLESQRKILEIDKKILEIDKNQFYKNKTKINH